MNRKQRLLTATAILTVSTVFEKLAIPVEGSCSYACECVGNGNESLCHGGCYSCTGNCRGCTGTADAAGTEDSGGGGGCSDCDGDCSGGCTSCEGCSSCQPCTGKCTDSCSGSCGSGCDGCSGCSSACRNNCGYGCSSGCSASARGVGLLFCKYYGTPNVGVIFYEGREVV